MIKLTIDRKRWVRGSGGRLVTERDDVGNVSRGDSELLNDRGRMCCLGFLAEACDVDMEECRGVGGYHDLPSREWTKLPTALRPLKNGDQSVLHRDLTNANDGKAAGKRREERIRRLMKLAGVSVRFKG